MLNTRCKLSSIGQCCYSLGYVLPSCVPVCSILVGSSSISALDWSERSQGVLLCLERSYSISSVLAVCLQCLVCVVLCLVCV